MSSQPPDDDNPWLIDFFEEGETRENVPHEEAPSTPEGARPHVNGPPSREGRMRAGWLALVVGLILVVTIVVTAAVSGSSESSADSDYLTKLAGPASDSQNVGTSLNTLLSTGHSSMKTLESNLSQLLARQEQALNETEAISPPPRLRSEQQQAVSAMQFRVGGLSGLLLGFREAAARPTGANWATQLSDQAAGLITSDVIWRDLFATPASAQIAADGTHGATVPASTFVSNSNITAPQAMANVLAAAEGHAASTSSSSAPLGVLQIGDTSSAVKIWQQRLNEWIARQKGLTKLTVDGSFGPATQNATMLLQKAAGISEDGVVGRQTQRALTAALAKR